VTLPPEPYSGLICPHCQVEFSMQPTLRQPAMGAYTSLRQELAREARSGPATPQRPGGEVALAEVGDRVIALAPRRSPSALTIACQVMGLLGGGALGLVVGYCLLTYWGGQHFNVLELPLPWLGPMSAQSPSQESNQSPQATARPGSVDSAANSKSRGAAPFDAVPPHRAPQDPSSAKPRSQTAPKTESPTVAQGGPGLSGPRLTAASHVETAAGGGGDSTKQPQRPALPGNTPKYSLEELTRAASVARDALACPTCKSTGFVARSPSGREAAQRCPVCRGAAGAGITAEVYVKLCRLAEMATHADPGDENVLKAQQSLASVFRKAADRAEKQDAIGRHAAQRMASPPGDAKGILLVGTIERKEVLGEYHTTRLVLLGEPAAVVVLSSTPVPFQPGERAIIAGSIVADPTAQLPAYTGPRGAAVWGGMPLRLEE
jgi:hypothetical protein